MFLAMQNINFKNKEVEAGEIFEGKPAKWLIEQGIVKKISKKEAQEITMQGLKNDKTIYEDTEFEEVVEEE